MDLTIIVCLLFFGFVVYLTIKAREIFGRFDIDEEPAQTRSNPTVFTVEQTSCNVTSEIEKEKDDLPTYEELYAIECGLPDFKTATEESAAALPNSSGCSLTVVSAEGRAGDK